MSPRPAPATLRLALATVAAGVAPAALSAWLHLGWLPPSLVNPVIVLALAVAALRGRDPTLRPLLVAGVAAALVELAIADPAFVRRGVLHYAPGGPFVVDSPLYMPISWVFIVVQMGVIGLWLAGRFGLSHATWIMLVTGAVNGPTYEFLAQYANWWTYSSCWLVAGVPVFVIASEGAIGAVLPWLATQLAQRGTGAALTLGAALGAFMCAAGELGFGRKYPRQNNSGDDEQDNQPAVYPCAFLFTRHCFPPPFSVFARRLSADLNGLWHGLRSKIPLSRSMAYYQPERGW